MIPIPKPIAGLAPLSEPISGETYFNRLSEAEQRQILGAARWAAYQDGLFAFSDLTRVYQDNLYGPMRSESSLAQLIGVDAARAYRRTP